MKLILTSFTTFFSIFIGSLLLAEPNNYISFQEKLVNSILLESSNKIKNKFNLKSCGNGASMPGGVVKGLSLIFQLKGSFTKEILRSMLLDAAKDMLSIVNANKEIQPFLKTSPFIIDNIQIVIYIKNKDGKSLNDPAISVAQISHGVLNYRTNDPNDIYKYKQDLYETYLEALQALEENKEKA
jgi:hypothetical protein